MVQHPLIARSAEVTTAVRGLCAHQTCWPPSKRVAVGAATACALLVLAATYSPWRAAGVCSGDGLRAARPEQPEAPDSATVAICTIIRLDADDPQWVDGRAEDLLEVRLRTIASWGH